VGYDADFVVWSPEEMFTINTANIQHKNKITPYLGMQLSGVVHKVQCATQGILMAVSLYFSSVQKTKQELQYYFLKSITHREMRRQEAQKDLTVSYFLIFSKTKLHNEFVLLSNILNN
jgi:hypothetical protein